MLVQTERQTVLYSKQSDKLFHHVSYGVTHSHLGIGTGPDLAGGWPGAQPHRRRRWGARGLPSPTTPQKNPGKKHNVKFGHFVNFSYIISGKNVLPPPNLTELLPYAYGLVLTGSVGGKLSTFCG